MSGPVLALRRAILARLAADAGLAGLVSGPPVIHDEPPRAAAPVHALFGPVETRDWSSGGRRGCAQDVSILVWSRPGSAASGLAAAERIAALLDGEPLTLDGHVLVLLTVTGLSSDRDPRSRLVRTRLALRALTHETDPEMTP